MSEADDEGNDDDDDTKEEEEEEVEAKIEIPSSFFSVKEKGEKICQPTMTEYRARSRSLPRASRVLGRRRS